MAQSWLLLDAKDINTQAVSVGSKNLNIVTDVATINLTQGAIDELIHDLLSHRASFGNEWCSKINQPVITLIKGADASYALHSHNQVGVYDLKTAREVLRVNPRAIIYRIGDHGNIIGAAANSEELIEDLFKNDNS